MDKFLGLGLTNLIGVSIFTILFIVIAKVLLVKYPITGVSEVVQSV